MHTTTSHSGGNYFKLSVFANKCDVFAYGGILIIISMIKILINTIIKIFIKDTTKMAIISNKASEWTKKASGGTKTTSNELKD